MRVRQSNRIPLLMLVVALASISIARGAAKNLPTVFEVNRGQAGPGALFVARGPGYFLRLGRAGAELEFPLGQAAAAGPLRLTLASANPDPTIEGIEPLAATVSYLTGSDSAGWISGVPTYAAVRYAEFRPGVDLVLRGDLRRLEFELTLAPEADLDSVVLTVQGAVPEPTSNGEMLLRLPGAVATLSRPEVESPTAEADGRPRRPIDTRLVQRGENGIGFELVKSDRAENGSRIIRSTLTVLPASDGDLAAESIDALPEALTAIATGAQGVVYVAGRAETHNDAGAEHTEIWKLADAFVASVSSDGSALRHATWFGGRGVDAPRALVVDERGRVTVAGTTSSPDFPVVAAERPSPEGGTGAFVARLAPDGSGFEYSIDFGGSGQDEARSVALGKGGEVWVAGVLGGGAPLADAIRLGPEGGKDAFLALIAEDGSIRRAYRIGGSGDEDARSITIGAEGQLIVAGTTKSVDFPVVKALQPSSGGAEDAFVLALDTTGKRSADGILWSTYLGGAGADEACAVAADRSGAIYVAGQTRVDRLGAEPGREIVVSKLMPDGQRLEYSSRLGAEGNDTVTSVGVTARGELWIAGTTTSRAFPPVEMLAGSSQQQPAGDGRDGFAIRLDPKGEKISDARRLPGSGDDLVSGLVVAPDGRVLLAGTTDSADLAEARAIEPRSAGKVAFLSALSPQSPAFVCDRTFDGGPSGTGTAWGVAANWDPDGVPSATENACIGGSFAVVVSGGAYAAAALEVTSSAVFTITGGVPSLDLGGASSIGSGGLSLNAAYLQGTGDLTVSGPISWTSAIMEGTGATIVNGGMTISGGVGLSRHLINNSTITWTSGNFDISGGGIVDNQPGALFEARADNVPISHSSGAAQFNNRGTFRRTTGTGIVSVNDGVLFTNMAGATVDVESGTLYLQSSDVTHSGAFTVSAGATIEFHANTNTLDASSSLTGAGTVRTSGNGTQVNVLGTYDVASTVLAGGIADFTSTPTMGTLTMTGNGPLLTGSADIVPTGAILWEDGGMGGSGTTIVNAGMTITTTSGSLKALQRRLVNNSTVIWTAGSIGMNADGIVDNQPGAVIEARANTSFILNVSGAPIFNNRGTFRRTTGTGDVTLGIGGIVFTNMAGATVDVQSGTLHITSKNTTHSGAFTVGGGGTLEFNGKEDQTLDAASSVTGAGQVRFASHPTVIINVAGVYDIPTTTIAGGVAEFTSTPTMGTLAITGGVLQGAANIAPSGPITWTGGTISGPGTTFVNAGMTIAGTCGLEGHLVNNSTVTWTAGPIYLNGILDNQPGALFEAQPNEVFVTLSNQGQFLNRGLFRRTPGTGVLNLSTAIVTNTGTMHLLSGTLVLRGESFTQPGGRIVLDGGALSAGPVLLPLGSGTLEGYGTVTGNVVNDVSNGRLIPGLSPGILNIAGTYTQAQGAKFDVEIGGLAAGSQYDQVSMTGPATLGGTLDLELLNGFCPQVGDSFTIMNYPSHTGTFDTANLAPPCDCLGWVVNDGPASVVLTLTPVPVETTGLVFDADHETLRWNPVPIRSDTVYDVVRGALNELPVGPPGTETCLGGPGIPTTSFTDSAVPSTGQGFWYVVRERVSCGSGTYGHRSNGAERLTASCP